MSNLPPLNPGEFDAQVRKVKSDIEFLRTLPQAAPLFKPPAVVPPFSVIENLNPLTISRLNEQQTLYAFERNLSTMSTVKIQTDYIATLLLSKESTLNGIQLARNRAAASTAFVTASLDATIKLLNAATSSLTLRTSTVTGLQRQSTILAASYMTNRTQYSSTVQAINKYETFLGNQDNLNYLMNQEFAMAALTYSTAIKEYTLLAKQTSSLVIAIPQLQAAATSASRTLSNAVISRKAADARYESSVSTSVGYATLSTSLFQESVRQAAISSAEDSKRNQAYVYYTLANLYISSNDLKQQLNQLNTSHQTAGALIQEGGAAIGDTAVPGIAKAAYAMAHQSYLQLGGDLATVNTQYMSTVTGIDNYKQRSFGLITNKTNQAIATAQAEADGYIAKRTEAVQARANFASSLIGYTALQPIYAASSIQSQQRLSALAADIRTLSTQAVTVQGLYTIANETLGSLSNIYNGAQLTYRGISSQLLTAKTQLTIANQDLAQLTTRIPKVQADLDELVDAATAAEGSLAQQRKEVEVAKINYDVQVRYKTVAENQVIRSDRNLNYIATLKAIAAQRVKETDARIARSALSEQISARLAQLTKISDLVKGSSGPDLTDDTYMAMTNQMISLNTYIDEHYPVFYKAADRFTNDLQDYKELQDRIKVIEQKLVEQQQQLDQDTQSEAMQVTVSTTLRTLEALRGEERVARGALDSLRAQIDIYIQTLEANRNKFIPSTAQAKTEQAIIMAATVPTTPTVSGSA